MRFAEIALPSHDLPNFRKRVSSGWWLRSRAIPELGDTIRLIRVGRRSKPRRKNGHKAEEKKENNAEKRKRVPQKLLYELHSNLILGSITA